MLKHCQKFLLDAIVESWSQIKMFIISPSPCSAVSGALGPKLQLVEKPSGVCISVSSSVVSQIRSLGHNTRACCPDIPSRAMLTTPQVLSAPGTQARG